MSRHLIHIGFPKSGSTALAAWFAAHPQVDFAPNGIGGYYDAFGIAARASERPDASPRWHVTSSESLSTPRVSDEPTVAGPWTGRRSHTALADCRARVCATLQRLFPTATILIVTRGFRSAIVSGYSQYVRQGGRLPFEELARLHATDGVQFNDYDAVVALYEEAFGPERVIVLPYELLRDEPRTFVRALEHRLGLDGGAETIPALNRSLSPAGLIWYRRLSVLVALAARPLGRRAGDRLYAAYVAQLDRDRLRRPVGLLNRILPGPEVGPADIPDDLIERFGGRAAGLAARPHYAPYARDYLNDAPPRAAGT